MTDRNSITDIPGEPLTNLADSPTSTPEQDPKVVILPGVKSGGTDGFIRRRVGRPKNAERTGRTPDSYYDLKFPKGRRYRVVFTSISEPTLAFDVDFIATSLRNLLTQVAYWIGASHKIKAAAHFSVTFHAYVDNQKVIQTNVSVPFGEPLQADDRPLTVLPSFDEGIAL